MKEWEAITKTRRLNELGYRSDWIERQFAHVEPSSVRRTYNRAEHLAELLASSGLTVMNRVVSRKPLDEARFAQVRAAFAKAFPQLAAATPVIDEPGMANGR